MRRIDLVQEFFRRCRHGADSGSRVPVKIPAQANEAWVRRPAAYCFGSTKFLDQIDAAHLSARCPSVRAKDTGHSRYSGAQRLRGGYARAMKQCLRKTSAGVSVTYTDGNYSNNLVGSDFTLDASDESICVSVDLSCNLRVRDKDSNSYYDACELAEEHSKLLSLEIDDLRITNGLGTAHQRHRKARWQLELRMGDKGIFRYWVRPIGRDENIIFRVTAQA